MLSAVTKQPNFSVLYPQTNITQTPPSKFPWVLVLTGTVVVLGGVYILFGDKLK